MVQAFHQSKLDWVAGGFKHNWNSGPGGFGRKRRRCTARRDDGDLSVNKIGREARKPVNMTFGPVIFDRDVLTVDVTGFAESSSKGGREVGVYVGPADMEESDHRLAGLLCARRQRIKRGSAQKSDEFTSPHVPPPGSETIEHSEFIMIANM
jgi:hypothetical protein